MRSGLNTRMASGPATTVSAVIFRLEKRYAEFFL